jgi:hypothetical protein
LLIKIKTKTQNKFIVSEKSYIGITDTINGFRSTLASCEVLADATFSDPKRTRHKKQIAMTSDWYAQRPMECSTDEE